jgi:hypothetical protein
MNELTGYAKTSLFHFTRIFMSPQKRYAQLWARTKKLSDLRYGLQFTVADSNK